MTLRGINKDSSRSAIFLGRVIKPCRLVWITDSTLGGRRVSRPRFGLHRAVRFAPALYSASKTYLDVGTVFRRAPGFDLLIAPSSRRNVEPFWSDRTRW